MRADRLLSILMYLQARGRMTAYELAEELEVSERTIYRDLEALHAAGVPVLAERGPGGGCQLPEEYKVSLTGLTENEVRGLFLSPVSGPLADLGMGKALEAAMLKLSAALPSTHRRDVERMRQRVLVDTAQWFRPSEPVPYLPLLQEAVWQDRTLRFTYRRADGVHVKRTLDPYALVAKSSIWYLVGAAVDHARIQGVSHVRAARQQMRVYRVSRIGEAQLTDQTFERTATFDLPSFWSDWCAEFEASITEYRVKVRVAPDFLLVLPRIYGEGIHSIIDRSGPPDEEGWLTLDLTFESLEMACASVLGFGSGAEVLEPQELRDSVIESASRVVDFYNRRSHTPATKGNN